MKRYVILLCHTWYTDFRYSPARHIPFIDHYDNTREENLLRQTAGSLLTHGSGTSCAKVNTPRDAKSRTHVRPLTAAATLVGDIIQQTLGRGDLSCCASVRTVISGGQASSTRHHRQNNSGIIDQVG